MKCTCMMRKYTYGISHLLCEHFIEIYHYASEERSNFRAAAVFLHKYRLCFRSQLVLGFKRVCCGFPRYPHHTSLLYICVFQRIVSACIIRCNQLKDARVAGRSDHIAMNISSFSFLLLLLFEI